MRIVRRVLLRVEDDMDFKEEVFVTRTVHVS
jgi:hypothetical protein